MCCIVRITPPSPVTTTDAVRLVTPYYTSWLQGHRWKYNPTNCFFQEWNPPLQSHPPVRMPRDHYEVLSQLMLPTALALRGRIPQSHCIVKKQIPIEVTSKSPRSGFVISIQRACSQICIPQKSLFGIKKMWLNEKKTFHLIPGRASKPAQSTHYQSLPGAPCLQTRLHPSSHPSDRGVKKPDQKSRRTLLRYTQTLICIHFSVRAYRDSLARNQKS